MAAVSLGVTIVASDDRGGPRLVRAVIPRAARAGATVDQAARDHLSALAPLWIQGRQASAMASAGQQRLRNGASIVRLQQQVDAIDIHQGELRVMLNPDSSLAAVSGAMRPSAGRVAFTSSPTEAIERALDALYGPTRARPALTAGRQSAGFQDVTVAAAPGLVVESARAKRELLADGDRLIPIWTVELLAEKQGVDDTVETAGRRYLIADAGGKVLREVDLISNDAFTYRAFADETGNRRPFDGALKSYNPHPTGTPDGSSPGLASYNLVAMDSFNATRDPWLPGDATTTAGNNVEAFADINPPGGFSEGDIRPDVRAGRVLNHRYDFTQEPLATPTQSKAAAVNVFFVTNWLHDWYYDSGFTEATGNAQLDNFGRGGLGGDRLVARAQATANAGSRDNAFMFTPSDGLSPIMRMFLWTGVGTSRLTAPTGSPLARNFLLGPRNFVFTGEVVLVNDVSGGTHKACGPVTSEVAGKIALLEFDDTCTSRVAVDNVKAAGAVGVIAMSGRPGQAARHLNGSPVANIPGVTIGNADGLALRAVLPATVTMHRTTTLEHDGDFDNSIIAHEWGHYLHHRLASCESSAQCDAMSEGWGDFVALHMMLRTADDREGTLAEGNYALHAGGRAPFGYTDPGYFGIRRFPYSIDRTKNALRFRHIGDDAELPAETPINPGPSFNPSSEVHNAGEVWATMLWEAYNVLLDEHTRAEARRRMTDYAVAGLLLTPPDATFTEARDAILAAAGALDTEDMLLMAAAFAGRGAGTCAASPDRTSTDFIGVVESGTVAAKLETSAISLTDDGRSCDGDGYLDPGESGTLRITIANSGVLAAENVLVTPTTATPGVTLGRPIHVGTLGALTHLDLEIPVSLSASAATNTTLTLAIRLDGDAGCDTTGISIPWHDRIGVDEATEVATVDTAETRISAWTATGESASTLWGRASNASNSNHSLFGRNAKEPTDTQLMSPVLQVSPTEPLVVTLQHAYHLEAFPDFGEFFDGGVIEVSTDGVTWRDVTEVGVFPDYDGILFTGSDNPLSGRRAFSGPSPSFPDRETLALSFGTQFAGQAVRLRFRIGTDAIVAAVGWDIDNIAVTGITNTPFTGFVAETASCSGGASPGVAGGVRETRSAPLRSLDEVPGAGDEPEQ